MQVRNLIVGALLFSCTGHVNAQSLTLRVDNIDQIVDSMTLEEKVNLLVGRNDYLFGGYEVFLPPDLPMVLPVLLL